VSDPLATTNPRRAWHDGRAAGRAEVAVVLLDLITELRAQEGHMVAGGEADPDIIAAAGRVMLRAADRAEARLREVQGE